MANESWVWVLEERIPSITKEGSATLEKLLDALRHQQWSDQDVFAVHLSLEEAIVNAILHGNQGDPQRSVDIKFHVAETHVRIEIVDEGPGFDPDGLPDPTADENLEKPSGRGVMLMRHYMDEVQYNKRGNHVIMVKKRVGGSS
ncbi:MAG: ATP-binding protein [Pirellulaceae bacterium]|jgi:serine/threonine-protein kinase RsbW